MTKWESLEYELYVLSKDYSIDGFLVDKCEDEYLYDIYFHSKEFITICKHLENEIKPIVSYEVCSFDSKRFKLSNRKIYDEEWGKRFPESIEMIRTDKDLNTKDFLLFDHID